MTGSTVDTNVDQVFFGWRLDGGLGAVASSCPDQAETERWHYLLQNRLRMHSMPGATLPAAAFSYLQFGDGTAAWVRRVSTGASAGRNNSRAVIGSDQVLDFYAAIGLSMVTTWSDDPQAVRWPAAKIQRAADQAQDMLQRIGDYDHELSIVLASLLANPAAPLSIIGGIEDEGCLAIIWALHRVARHYLPQFFAERRNWSFSTYEDQHDTGAGDLPQIVFLPTAQLGAGTVNRLVVDLAQPQFDAADFAVARHVVDYLIRNQRPDHTIVDGPPPMPAPLSASPPVVPSQPYANGASGALTVPRQPEPAPSAAPQAERSPVTPLLEARTVGEFVKSLRQLEKTWQGRGVLYPYVDAGALDKLAQFAEMNVRNELLERLLFLTYGPRLEGTRDAEGKKHAVGLIRGAQSEQLALMLGTAAPRSDEIREAAFARWADGAGKPPGTTNGMLARQWRGARHSRYFPWVTGGAVAVLLALVFILGFLVGRPVDAAGPHPTPTVVPPAPTTTKPTTEATRTTPPTTTQPTTPQDNATDPGQDGGNPNGGNPNGGGPDGVPIRADNGGTAWTFQRVDDTHFIPLAPCQQANGNNWVCSRPSSANSDQVFAMAVAPGTDLSSRVGQRVTRHGDWGQPTKVG
jgi:hypothetical protein